MNEVRKQNEEQSMSAYERDCNDTNRIAKLTIASDVEMDDLEDASFRTYQSSPLPKWARRTRANSKLAKLDDKAHSQHLRMPRNRSRYHQIWRLALHLPYLIAALLLVIGVLFPSYDTPPRRYQDLRRSVLEARRDGAANPRNEKIFIAASLHDNGGQLLRGAWGQSVLYLIDMLGHDNVFVSIYENDPSEVAMLAMSDFRQRLPCPSSVVHEKLDTSKLHHVTTADGTQRLKRIAFLAEARNRALQPLDDKDSKTYNTSWDRLLYLNDVIFDPIDAASLLFNTNVDKRTGRADYRAACAVDFIDPFKFYDTFATRDLEGYGMGVPFYPWFTNAGQGQSRQDVLEQKDAVRVKSCWGGMVAFEAKWFQQQGRVAEVDDSSISGGHSLVAASGATDGTTLAEAASRNGIHTSKSHHGILVRSTGNADTIFPLRFRAQPDTFWDASECCLIHADLVHAAAASSSIGEDVGIYMNPYIRVAYSASTLRWLPFTRRFERLYTLIHSLVNWIGVRPMFNPRQFERPGEQAEHWVWRWDDDDIVGGNAGIAANVTYTGSYVRETVTVAPGMFCGTRKLLFLKEGDEARRGGKNWGSERVPAVPSMVKV